MKEEETAGCYWLLEKGTVQNAPLEQIASYLGITDSSLSRIRKEIIK